MPDFSDIARAVFKGSDELTVLAGKFDEIVEVIKRGGDVNANLDDWVQRNSHEIGARGREIVGGSAFRNRMSAIVELDNAFEKIATSNADKINIDAMMRRFQTQVSLTKGDLKAVRDSMQVRIDNRERVIAALVEHRGLSRTEALDEYQKIIADGADQTKLADAAGKGAKALDEAAKPGMLDNPWTMRRFLRYKALTAGIVAVPVIYEVESGGALSQATIEGMYDVAVWAKEHDLPHADELLSTARYMGQKWCEYSSIGWRAAQNAGIRAALGEGDEEGIRNAQITAVSLLATQSLGIALDYAFLERENEIRYGHLPQAEQDKLLAADMIDRLVDRCDFNALKDHPVTKEHVKAYLAENKDGLLENGIVPARIRDAVLANLDIKEPEAAATTSEKPAATGAIALGGALASTADGQKKGGAPEEDASLKDRLLSTRDEFQDKGKKRAREAVDRTLTNTLGYAQLSTMSVKDWGTDTLSGVFDAAQDKSAAELGLSGFKGVIFDVVSFMAGIVGFFNKSAGAALQGYALSMIDTDKRLALLKGSLDNGEARSQFGDRFALGRPDIAPEPALG